MTTPTENGSQPGRGEHHRNAFGIALDIDPQISLPGLRGDIDPTLKQPPSHIRLNSAELNRRWDALMTTPVRTREVSFGETLLRSVDFAEPAGYLLWARNYGRVLISPDGMDLLCDPEPAQEDWAHILSAQALPLAATLRGLKVLHASGVVLDGGALLFAGPTGAGKSSLAAALVRVGGRLLSDDAIALAPGSGAPIAYPGSMALQLRTAEDERLVRDQRVALGRPMGFIEGKRRYMSTSVAEAAPLGYVFLLERSARGPVVEQIEAVDPFELIASTFNLSVHTPARLRRQLDLVSAIASSGVVHRLRLQPDVNASALAELVQEHVACASALGAQVRPDAKPARYVPMEL